jgi:hypothetical protein
MIDGLAYLITSIDIVSEKPQILLNRSFRSKTIYGGCLSLVPLLCIIVATSVFVFQMFTHANGSLTYNKVPSNSTTYNYGQFPFMVALLDNGLKLINDEDRYYYFLADIWNFAPDNSTGSVVMNLTRVPVKTEKCNIDVHFGEYRDFFKDVPYLEHHYCAVPGQNITLYGVYGSIQPYNFLDFWISTCVNDTSVNRTNCRSREESKARLVNTYISYQSLQYYIDHSNINNPGQLILNSQILPVSSTIYKRDFFYVRNVNYYSDFDYIFSNSKLQTYSLTSEFRETADLRPEGTVPGSFALISILMDSSFDQYNRSFTKFQQVLANVGGLFKGLIILTYFVNYIFFEELYYQTIISSIFKSEHNSENRDKEKIITLGNLKNKLKPHKKSNESIEMKPQSDPEQHKNSSIKYKQTYPVTVSPYSSQNLMNLNESNFTLNISKLNQTKVTKNKETSVIKLGQDFRPSRKLSKQPNDIKLSFLDLICARFFKRKGKYKTYELAKAYTENNLCIKNILQKLSEVNKLKCFVFNQEQLAVFNSIKNPSYYNIIHENDDIWQGLVLPEGLYKDKNLIEKFKAKQNISDMDQNFLNILKLYE